MAVIPVEPVKQYAGKRVRKVGYRAKIGPIHGEGATPTEARQAAIQEAEKVLSEDWEPYVVTAHGWIGIVFKEWSGWTYTIKPLEEFATVKKARGLVIGTLTREEAIRKMLWHLIQTIGPEAMHLAQDENMREDLERYFRAVEELREELRAKVS